MFENADLYRANYQNAILTHSDAIVLDIRSSGQLENILSTNYRRFSGSVELWEVVCQSSCY